MKLAPVTERLANLGGDKWHIFSEARARIARGEDILELCIGEPDVPTPDYLADAAIASIKAGRTLYSDGMGEINLRKALAEKYTKRSGYTISPDQVICFPGTQTALYAVFVGLASEGQEVIVGNPMYATYEGVIRSSGAKAISVPLKRERDFRIDPKDIEAAITENTAAIFLNSPHNPTGAILTKEDMDAIGALAKKHDLWIVSDEVYEELVFEGESFHSPLTNPDYADNVVVVASISKSHAAPGFRSGWCIGSEAFCKGLLPLAEIMLFGNQPFIADMTALAVSKPSKVARDMAARFAKRAQWLEESLHENTALRVQSPKAGMFALVDVRSGYDLSGDEFAQRLLDEGQVAVMPGSVFGIELEGWLRVTLTQNDEATKKAIERIVTFANSLSKDQ